MSGSFKNIITHYINVLFLRGLSIKTLTLLGFSLVLLPLIIALLYSSSQVNHLAQQGSQAIFNVAELVETNRQLSASANKMQRFAGQYIVLQESGLLTFYQENKSDFTELLTNKAAQYQQAELNRLSTQIISHIKAIDKLLSEKANQQQTLSDIEQKFKSISQDMQQIELLSDQLINQQVEYMQSSADKVTTTIWQSLAIIPFSVLLAVIFALLILRPLRQLSSKIKRLEQGHFEDKISFKGTKEIKEIADALELMRSRLHSLELQKSSFIRHISHELKTPLAAIREGTELLYDNSVGSLNAEQQEVTNIIKLSVSRLQQLIEDLLDFNIVLDSTSLQDAQQVNFTNLLTQCLKLRQLDIQSKQLKISTECQALTLKTNSKQLSVILDNLLSNAIKYSPINGEITITAQAQQQQVVISITDQGPGIEPELQQKVFEAFYHGPTPEQSPIKSSGLGLTIVKELLMRLDGDINIANLSPPEHGLTIQLALPVNP
ncbi:sensor histidine kinase [Thalassotalea insulae]|uniref:sensor histidine kinase n=1 Tax=Thalassotalea insulae TaxID=2056778 RepID=UPI0024E10128|nr:ATP-binding protein [Thalassotalea insulae]